MNKLFKQFTNIIPKNYERLIKLPIIITLIVIFQGSFGGMGVIQTPKILEQLREYSVVRFFYVFTIALSATQDIEISILSSLIFFGFIYLLRDEEERKTLPLI